MGHCGMLIVLESGIGSLSPYGLSGHRFGLHLEGCILVCCGYSPRFVVVGICCQLMRLLHGVSYDILPTYVRKFNSDSLPVLGLFVVWLGLFGIRLGLFWFCWSIYLVEWLPSTVARHGLCILASALNKHLDLLG